jgi:hypothetical protein
MMDAVGGGVNRNVGSGGGAGSGAGIVEGVSDVAGTVCSMPLPASSVMLALVHATRNMQMIRNIDNTRFFIFCISSEK